VHIIALVINVCICEWLSADFLVVVVKVHWPEATASTPGQL